MKMKVKLTKPLDACSPLVQQWVAKHNITFDRNGYADAPRTTEGDLYHGENTYHVPLSNEIICYQTLDNRHYYLDRPGFTPVKRRMVTQDLLLCDITKADEINILSRKIVRGSEIAVIAVETVYYGPLAGVPAPYITLERQHFKTLRESSSPRILKKSMSSDGGSM